MKTHLLRIALALALLSTATGLAAQNVSSAASSSAVKDVDRIDSVLASQIDLVAIAEEDAARDQQGLPPRYAIPEAVSITTANHGTWDSLPDGSLRWRLRILGREGTTSLNLGFSRFQMSAHGRLLLYSADGSQKLRPFTSDDNEAHGQLWTPPVITNDLIVELAVPASEKDQVGLELTSINQGYRGFGTTPLVKSGSCNLDVECLDPSDPWRIQMQAVAVISTGGSTFCTGSLINDTANDHKMYFITANHCTITAGNAASLVAFWNYQNSFCRTPGSTASGQAGDGTLTQFHTGSFFRSASAASDFTLVELDDPPVPAYNHFWEGWDRSTGNVTCTTGAPCAGIHHPNTDEKRITYSVTNMVPSSWATTPPPTPGDGSHIWVHWATDPPGPFTVPGVTEPGSSGSPLYNAAGRFIGQLHGGASACGATGDNLSDIYGRFSVSWTGGGTDSTRLSNWLDAGNTGATAIDGVAACTAPGAPAIGTATATAPNTIQVTWADGSPSSTTFNVYRASGTCASPGAFAVVGPGVAASPFNDGTVSGGTTYAFHVTGRDSTGACESVPSGCVEATATGSCTLPPTFAGLTSASNNAAASCGITLSWSAATANCGGPITYNVYRSSLSGFVPGPGNRIATGVTGTTYTDASGTLVSGTTYYYVVRAVDSSNAVEDGNTVQRSTAPTGPIALGNLVETFEGGGGFDNPGWAHNPIAGAVDWVLSTTQSQTPTHSWFSASQTSISDRVLVTPTFVPQATSTLSFFHTFAFETNAGGTACYDAGTLEISIDGGSTWSVVPDAAFTAGGFNGTVNTNFDNPILGKRAWCQGTIGAMTQVTVNLASFVGASDVKLRWHEGDDSSAQGTGWFVDSVTLNNVGAASTCSAASILFNDGFESGTTGAWSSQNP
jgi:lysyl endopeptidase